MISFSRDGKTLKAIVETGLNSTTSIRMSFECSSEMCAEMLAHRLRERLGNTVEAIRQAEYEDGYKAARSRVAKRKYFYWSLENKSY